MRVFDFTVVPYMFLTKIKACFHIILDLVLLHNIDNKLHELLDVDVESNSLILLCLIVDLHLVVKLLFSKENLNCPIHNLQLQGPVPLLVVLMHSVLLLASLLPISVDHNSELVTRRLDIMHRASGDLLGSREVLSGSASDEGVLVHLDLLCCLFRLHKDGVLLQLLHQDTIILIFELVEPTEETDELWIEVEVIHDPFLQVGDGIGAGA